MVSQVSAQRAASGAREVVAVDEPLNEVRLRGRFAGAVERELPSGDHVVTARLVVPRVGGTTSGGAAVGVDTIDCALWSVPLRRRALKVPEGTVVEVEGTLRRRFWRGAGGPASRYEVEVSALRRLTRG